MTQDGPAAWGAAHQPPLAPALDPLAPRDTTALVRAVRDRLRLAITLEQIPAGKLNQVDVAKRLGVSRMPIRAAIPGLVAEGLLDPLPGGGVAVRPLTASDVREVYDVRLALETKAARIVADHAPEDSLREIVAVVARHLPAFATYDAGELLAADREFHMTVLAATENDYFPRAMLPVWSTVERAMVKVLHIPQGYDAAWHEHAEISRALAAHDADAAEAAMSAHLENAANSLTASILESLDDPSVG